MDGEDERDVSTRLTQQIDENLKRVYQDIVGSNVPDKFLDLLDRLRDQDGDVHEEAAPRAQDSPMPDRSMAGARR